MQRSLRVLIVAYYFPPEGAIGGVRPYQVARHLPDFGIEPWILTVQPHHAEELDAAFLPQGIEPSRVMRTTVEDTLRDRMFRLWQRTMMRSRNDERPGSRAPV